MKLGCSTLLYGGFDLPTTLKGISDAGYAAIELCQIGGMAEHLPDSLSEDEYRDIAKMAADNGLVIESIGSSTSLLDEDARKIFIKRMEAGTILGAPAITSGSGGASDDDESFAEVVKVLTELGKVSADTGVKLSIKPHVGCSVYNTESSLRFMNEVDPEWIGLNVDGSHLWRTPVPEVPEDSVASLAPYIVTGRIRDTLSHEKPIGPVPTQVPGGGAMNLPAVCAAFKKVDGLEYITLEIVGMKEMSADEVKDVVDTAKSVLDPYLA